MGTPRVQVRDGNVPVMVTPPLERFYRHTRREGECLIWTGTFTGSKGRYPQFRATTRMQDPKVYAHRWIYEQMVGPIPEGYQVDHVKSRGCVGPACVEWTHLEAVPGAVNEARERLTVCKAGLHDLTDPANINWDKHGRRRGCRPCMLALARKHANRAYQTLKAEAAKLGLSAYQLKQLRAAGAATRGGQ